MSEAIENNSPEVSETDNNSEPEAANSLDVTNDDTNRESPKKYKVKIDGEELEVDEEELLRGYQTKKAADKRFQEGAMARKQAEEFVRLLKEDPFKVLSNPQIGHDVRQLAEEFLASQLEEEMLSDEERERREMKRKLQEYEESEKKKKQEQEELQKKELKQRYAQDYQNQIKLFLPLILPFLSALMNLILFGW